MPPRSQLLMLSGTLAIGMIIGSLATAVFRPAVQTIAKAGSKAEGPGAKVAPPAAQAVATAVLKAGKPAIEVTPLAVPAVAKAAPKAEQPKPPAFFPAPPPQVADLGCRPTRSRPQRWQSRSRKTSSRTRA